MSFRLLRSLSSLSIVAALALAACSANDPLPDDPTVAKGEKLVKDNACAACHSSSNADEVLSGEDTPYTGKQYGANLTPDKETGIGSWTDANITNAILKGVDDEGKMLCDAMPRFMLSDAEVASMVLYLRGIPAVKHAVTASECPGIK